MPKESRLVMFFGATHTSFAGPKPELGSSTGEVGNTVVVAVTTSVIVICGPETVIVVGSSSVTVTVFGGVSESKVGAGKEVVVKKEKEDPSLPTSEGELVDAGRLEVDTATDGGPNMNLSTVSGYGDRGGGLISELLVSTYVDELVAFSGAGADKIEENLPSKSRESKLAEAISEGRTNS
ncbi:hypothetical protein NLJ89_g5353 [Agrocybe chaxingu]|uniref:Uncharacterized protein n=1 Tax=Agrocybe chaxingu TaxID=84603 RepID=A0A9W8K170_9AGAR|nr:hypothetical protein NLJ89_g5353 [Agrocybe chaxingu]